MAISYTHKPVSVQESIHLFNAAQELRREEAHGLVQKRYEIDAELRKIRIARVFMSLAKSTRQQLHPNTIRLEVKLIEELSKPARHVFIDELLEQLEIALNLDEE